MVRIATLDDDGLLTPGQVPALATLGATATGEALVEAVDAAAARTAIGMTAAGSAVATAADASAQRAALGLGTAAVAATGDFATAAQGGLADTATQPGDLGNAAGLDVGTTAGTVAAGDDSRITGALPAADLDTAVTALDANAASALRVQQDARLLSTFARHDGPTIVLFGDSRTSDCWYSTGNTTTASSVDWFSYGQACATGGPRFKVVANAGTGGNTTTQMQARLQSDVLDLAPSAMTLWGGTNDGWTTTAHVDATIVRMKAMIEAARAAGVYVFAISETTSSLNGTTFPHLVSYYNTLMRAWCAGQRGVEWWDFNGQIVNPTDANGYPTSALLRDGLHLSVKGAATVGKNVVAPALSRIGHPIVALASSIADTQSTNAASRNILANPLMQGSSGTLGAGGHSGTVPTSWSTGGAHTVVFSVPARSDGYGNDLKAEITSSASGTTFLTQTLTAARLVPGKTYVLEGNVAIDAADGLFRTSIAVNISSPVAYTWATRFQAFAQSATETLIPMDQVIRSREFTVPAGATVSAADLTISVGMSKAGTGTLRIGRLTIRQID